MPAALWRATKNLVRHSRELARRAAELIHDINPREEDDIDSDVMYC